MIYNRLHMQMALGIDATLLYEYGSWTHRSRPPIWHPDALQHTGAQGLPPTPICNPGLRRCRRPRTRRRDYLYYVAAQRAHVLHDSYNDFVAHGG